MKLGSQLFVEIVLGMLAADILHGAPVFTALVSFDGTNGSRPNCSLIQGDDCQFYGTTSEGGTNYEGTVFKMTPGGNLTTLVSFDGTNGEEPQGGLTAGQDGNYYGTTQLGGTNFLGSIFRVTPQGQFTNLFFFASTNGAWPGGLISGKDGEFYGMTEHGGDNQYGTVFKLAPDGTFVTLYSFSGFDGGYGKSGLIEDGEGNLYSETMGGGTNYAGTVFKMTLDGTLIWSVSFNGTNGVGPTGELVKGADGDFYGLTSDGGTNWPNEVEAGTLFKITPDGSLTTIFYFSDSDDYDATNSYGSGPSSLILGDDDHLYGATTYGGENGVGTIFEITTNGSLATLYSFGTITTIYGTPLDGANSKQLVKDKNGNLYGTAYLGGEFDNIGNGGLGTIFQLSIVSPTIDIQFTGSSMVLSWDNPAFSLQAAPTANGVYTNVTGATSPYTNVITGSQMFFRLQSD